MKETLRDYWCFDNETGETFFVECEGYDQALEIVATYWGEDNDVEVGGWITPMEAELWGYDTY